MTPTTTTSTSNRPSISKQIPSAEQLSAARVAHWHQDAKPLQSIEALREWLSRSGLVLYAPRAQQLPSPAPSLVEATLGRHASTVEMSEMETARTLLARLIAEGSAVPLNLLGTTGATGTDVPDYVVSASVFSYIFTLRGNKAWKQMPATAGAVKVSPLALAAYEMLAAKVSLSVYDLTTQLGKEVTEAAVLRALTELWSQMRVLPAPQMDGSATLWELASARFTKQIKSGANAGQPAALSALISLYLGQSMLATEDEIETFLSPLAPRSRVRGVIHDLLAARQLDTLAIEGKTLLHVAGDLPIFGEAADALEDESRTAENTTSDDVKGENDAEKTDGPRISKFTAKPGSKIGTGLRSKPAGRTGFGSKPAFGRGAAGAGRTGASSMGFSKPRAGGDRERRPFERGEGTGSRKPMFNKPWEEKTARITASSTDFEQKAGVEAGGLKPAAPAREAMPRAGGDRPKFGNKPRFGGREEGFGGRGKGAGESRPPRRESAGGSGESTGPRKTFSKPGTFGRKREGGSTGKNYARGEGRPPRVEAGAGYAGRGGGDGRPPRREGSDRAERPVFGGVKRPGSYSPRPRGEAGAGFQGKSSFGARPGGQGRGQVGDGAESTVPRKVFRKFDAPRDKKPFAGKSFGSKPFGDKPGAKPFGAKPPGTQAFGSDRPARSADAPRSFDKSRPAIFERPRGESRARSEARPKTAGRTGDFAANKSSGKAGGFARSGSPFAKFADGKKPFRKPGPAKKSTGGGGGLKPTRRKRPEGNE